MNRRELLMGTTALALMGVAGTTAWRSEALTVMAPGQTMTVGPYTLRFDGVTRETGPNYVADRAHIALMNGNKAQAVLLPEHRFYPAEGQDMNDTAIHTTGLRDLYLALGDDRGGGRFALRAYVSPLAPLIHGGPGRAGGGEEMGGIRGVLHYMQRTAVQGSPDTLTAVGGEWVRGSRLRDPGRHPFRIPFNDLELGDTLKSGEREVTIADIEQFAALSGDNFYAHMSETEAARNPLFGGRVAHGYFLISAAAGLFVDPDYGPVLGNYGLDQLRFVKPAKPGDRIKVRLTCARKSLRADKGWGEVAWDTEITNQNQETVASYTVLTMVSVHAVPDSAENAA